MDENKGIESGRTLDSLITRARAKAQALGMDPKIGEILCANSEEEANERGQKLGTMGEAFQLAMYVLQAIYPVETNVRESSRSELLPIIGNWGLPDNLIEKYLTKFGDYPEFKFEFEYGEQSTSPVKIDRSRQMILRNAVRNFVLITTRRYFQS